MKIEISTDQRDIISHSVEQYKQSIWDDPEAHGFDEDEFDSEEEKIEAIEKFIKDEVDTLLKKVRI